MQRPSFLNGDQIYELMRAGVINGSSQKAINSASLDIHLADSFIVEDPVIAHDQHLKGIRVKPGDEIYPNDIIYNQRKGFQGVELKLNPGEGIRMLPGRFILGHTKETFKIPNNIGVMLRTKSSMGRIALEHMDAGWIDPEFHGSLTLELKNELEYHNTILYPGDPIGQLLFFTGDAPSETYSYLKKGNYNGDLIVKQAHYRT